MFQLLNMTPATIANVNTRMEKHGKDAMVPAVDVRLNFDMPNSVLQVLAPGLLHLLYTDDESLAAASEEDDQEELDFEAADVPMPYLKETDLVLPLGLKTELHGYCVTVDYGLGGKRNLVLNTSEVNKFTIEPKNGGTVKISCRVQCADHMDERILGKLDVLQQKEIKVTITAPEVKQEQAPIENPFPVTGDAPAGEGGDLPAGSAEAALAATAGQEAGAEA